MQAKITKRLVDELVKKHQPIIVFDDALAGFCLRIRKTGVISYEIRYRMGGRDTPKKTFTLGRHGTLTPEKARRLAHDKLADVRKGIDPAAEKAAKIAEQLGAKTLEEVAEDYLALHVAKRKPRTVQEYRKLFKNSIFPRFGSAPIDTIIRAAVERWHHDGKSTPYAANRSLVVLSAMMSWATTRGLRAGDNPCIGIEKYKEQKRKRYLSEVEISRVGEAIRDLEAKGDLTPHLAAFFRILLLTGLRRDEVRLLQWSRVDRERGVVILRDEDSKGGARDVPLSAPVRDILFGPASGFEEQLRLSR